MSSSISIISVQKNGVEHDICIICFLVDLVFKTKAIPSAKWFIKLGKIL